MLRLAFFLWITRFEAARWSWGAALLSASSASEAFPDSKAIRTRFTRFLYRVRTPLFSILRFWSCRIFLSADLWLAKIALRHRLRLRLAGRRLSITPAGQ